jgi:ABC-type branched-subunit amino acid transport system ATPase component
LADEGMAVLIVEQNAALALRYCDRISVMQTGTIIADGNADELRESAVLRSAYLGHKENRNVAVKINMP